jgi:flagellar hook-associated protein 1 FlgK
MANQINQQAVTYNTNTLPTGDFTAAAGTLSFLNQPYSIGSINVSQGESLGQIAASINSNATLSAAGVQATVGTNGTEQWLQVYNQQGKSMQMAEVMSDGGAPQLSFSQTQLATATVIGDGSGQRLQITHSTDSTLQATGTVFAATNMGPAALNTSTFLSVPESLQQNPTLLPTGNVQYDSSTNSFFVGDASNTNAQAMANFMTTPLNLPSSGGLTQGNLTLQGYAADIIATASTAASNTNTQVSFQQQLVSNLTNQQGQVSGVNLDQEISNLMTYQQSYSASAKVISTMQQLFQVLDSIVQ